MSGPAGTVDVAARVAAAQRVPLQDRRLISRVDEPGLTVAQLGDLVAVTRRPIFRAPCPCVVRSVGLTSRSTLPKAAGNRWDMVWTRRTTNFLSAYQADSVAAGDVAHYWPLDDAAGSTTAADLVGSLPLTINGTPTLEALGAPVGRQSALTLTAGAQYLSSAAVDLALGNSFSLEVWFAPDHAVTIASSGQRMNLLGALTADGTAVAAGRPWIVLRRDDDRRPNGLGIVTRPAGSEVWPVKTANWCGWLPNEWNLLTYVRSSTAASTDLVFVNGCQIPVSYETTAAYADSSHVLIVGGEPVAVQGEEYVGGLDELVIFAAPVDLASHQDRYGAIVTKSTRVESVVAHRPWLALDAFHEQHRLLDTGDVIVLEANPMYQAGPLAQVAAHVTWEAI